MVNGYSIVTYQRQLKPADEFDLQIYTNKSQAIIWAIGPLNQRDEVSFHSQYTKGNQFIDFGRTPKWNCPMPENDQPSMKAVPSPAIAKKIDRQDDETTVTTTTTTARIQQTPASTRGRNNNSERRRGGGSSGGRGRATTPVVNDSERSASTSTRTRQQGARAQRFRNNVVPTPAPVSKRNAWVIPPIRCDEPDDGVFYAQMGPTGGKRGYPAITGHVGWGISWYINGLLIPEINVVRGKSYNFVVEGGFDPEIPAKYHPFYITDDSVGGYEHKTAEERKVCILIDKIRLFFLIIFISRILKFLLAQP